MANSISLKKLHIGCGNQIIPHWVNHDLVPLPGVDVVHDLTVFPWPFHDDTFDEIKAYHVLEHLPETIKTLEEIYRISASNARVHIRVPYWNSPDMISDPTHRVFFNEQSMDYFDPKARQCIERPYYSFARFEIVSKSYFIKLRGYREIKSEFGKKLLECMAKHLCGVIWVINYELQVLK